MMMKITKLERIVDYNLEQYSLEEFLEFFDLTPLDAIVTLYDQGMIDDDVLEGMTPTHE